MNNKLGVLVKNLLLSTSTFNTLKYEKNPRKRDRAIGMLTLKIVLFIIIAGYSLLAAFGYGMIGAFQVIPMILATILSLISMVFAFLEVNGYLFAFRDYDMIMSLPFNVKDVVTAKFIYMYLKRIPWFLGISLCVEIPYVYFAKPGMVSIILWIVGAFFIPVIPMLAATAIGAFIMGISVKFKHKHVVEIALNFLLLGFVFYLAAKTGHVTVADGDLKGLLQILSVELDKVGRIYPPVLWYQNIAQKADLRSFLSLVIVSVVLYEVLFFIISKFYRKINARLLSGVEIGNFTLGTQKSSTVLWTLIRKEWKRFTASSLYFMNAGMGIIMGLILPVSALFVDVDQALSKMERLPMNVTSVTLIPAAPILLGLMIAMCDTSCMSPSLEGKSYWILQTLPLSKKQINQSKVFFNMLLQIPVAIIGNICFGIALKAGVVNTILYVLCGLAICLLTSSVGLFIGIKFIRLEWENEVEIIKQGVTVAIYLLPTIFVFVILIALTFVLGTILKPTLVLACVALIMGILGMVFYKIVTSD